jgi:pyruvate/2-oxoglutarate dehydrogenase complex dihydrolipoamide dehydrogenase (E3) component
VSRRPGQGRATTVDVPESVDAIVLGMGPGGEDLAGRLAEAGMSVVGIDATLLGGECPYWGCVPSKMMVRAAGLLAEASRINGIAGVASAAPDWRTVARRVATATDDWNDAVAVERFRSKGGHFVRGWGVIEGPGRVRVGDTLIEAGTALVVATGSSPSVPPVPGLEATPYWTNREAIECDELPASLAVLGGGAIGVELGQVFARFGVEVHVVEAADRLVAMEEPESSAVVHDALVRDGVRIHTGVRVEGVEEKDGRVTIRLSGGEVSAARLLVATGRHPNLAAIGAASLGVDVHARGIPIDGRCRVRPGVWAIGDVTGIGAFTHLSVYQGRIAAADILGRDPEDAAYHALPRVTFTDPEVGAVGLTEAQARAQGMDVGVAVTQLASSARGWIHGPGNAGFVKLVEDRARGVLVGATTAGPMGGEMLGLVTLAVHARVPTAVLAQMIYAYPTFHRAIEDTLTELRSQGKHGS